MKIDLSRACLAAFLMFVLLYLLISLTGCKVGEKAINKYKASSEFPADCDSAFPIKTDTTFLPGIAVHDTSIHVEYIDKPGKDYVIEKLTTKTVTVTKRIRDTIKVTIESTAKYESLKRLHDEFSENFVNKVAGLEAKNNQLQKRLATRTKQRNWGFGLIAAFIAFSFRHRIVKMFV